MSVEDRVLLLALRGRDAPVIEQVLSRQGHLCLACRSCDELAGELAAGAGTALVTEESLADTDRRALERWLDAQPPWSDFPFVLLATKRAGRRPRAAVQVLDRLGNVIVLERPIHGETLVSAVASALRGRRRQYEAREHLSELLTADEQMRHLNANLETRIGQRTEQLSAANNQLMQEIAQRERAQAALVQSQKMEAVGQLTGGIAHDFNNLLTVISGNLELIRRRAAEPSSSAQVDYAMQAVDRAAKLTRQLLAFSRTQRLTLRPVDINDMIRGMDDLLDRAIGPMFEIQMDLDPAEPWALADANQAELAILNLAINARDAMVQGGVIHISTARRAADRPDLCDGDYVTITVRDTGVGIPANLLDRVFDPFFTTKPLGKGTGLGLSQVYGIAQQSGGTVRIDSVEGEGVSVEIWLPSAEAVDEALADRPSAPALQARRGARILLIEDDEGVRRFMAECLEALGHAVTTAAEGREGLEQLETERPQLMIVDYAMPGLNGVEVVTAARALAPDLPVIMATGYADMDAVHAVLDPDFVLRKPFQIGDLDRAVRRALAAAPPPEFPSGRRAELSGA